MLVRTSAASNLVSAANGSLRPDSSRTLKMMRTSDPHSAARLGLADMLYHGLVVRAKSIGAYRFNVCGRGVLIEALNGRR